MTNLFEFPSRIWKPTALELQMILDFCGDQYRRAANDITVEVAQRYNVNRPEIAPSINVARVTDHPTWHDTDIKTCLPWAALQRGVNLNKGGGAVCELYVSGRAFCSLIGNVRVYVETRAGHAGIVRMSAAGRGYDPMSCV